MAEQRYFKTTVESIAGGNKQVSYHKAHLGREVLAKFDINLLKGERAIPGKIYAHTEHTSLSYQRISREEYEKAQSTKEVEAILTVAEAEAVKPAPRIYASVPDRSRRNRSRAMFGVYASV